MTKGGIVSAPHKIGTTDSPQALPGCNGAGGDQHPDAPDGGEGLGRTINSGNISRGVNVGSLHRS